MRLRVAMIWLALCSAVAFHPVASQARAIEQEMQRHGLVDIRSLDPTIAVDMKYSTTDNFVGKDMYGDFDKAYFRPEVAKMIVKAQKLLKAKGDDYSLVIYDAARPLSIQKRMYDAVKNTKNRRYVAYPYSGGGHHNFGLAVDLTVAYKGKPIDMGAGFDDFRAVSHIDREAHLLKTKQLSVAAYKNRLLLRGIMKSVGFNTFRREWWHFDYRPIKYARTHYKVLDF